MHLHVKVLAVTLCTPVMRRYPIARFLESKYCKRITFSCIFFLAFWQKAVSAKSNTSVNAMHICIRIGASRNKLIQSTLNCLKINFRQI